MKRIKGFDRQIGESEYELPVTPDTPYVIDDSSFVPMSEAVKQLGHVNSDGSDYSGYYDFADGEDTGIEIPITRTKQGQDIAEISNHIMNKVNDISEEVIKAKEFEEFKEQTNKRMEAMKNSPSGSSE